MRALVLLFLPLVLAGQSAQSAPAAVLRVHLPGAAPVAVDIARMSTLPRTSGTVTLHGTAIRYEGVALRDVLRAAGVARVDSLRGAALRQVVRLMGADDYTVVIALAELDPSLGALHAVIVDRENGAPLPAATGPFRLIVPRDGRASRAVRQLVRIDVIALP